MNKRILKLMEEIKESIQNIPRITIVKPGDSVIIGVPGIRNQEDIERVKHMIDKHPPSFQYVIMPVEFRIDVLREETKFRVDVLRKEEIKDD